MYWLFVYAYKYIFSEITIVKPQAETCEIVANVRIFYVSSQGICTMVYSKLFNSSLDIGVR